MTLDAETTTEDGHKINSIGWLVFDQSQRLDLLIESNTLIRAFLGKISTTYIYSVIYEYLVTNRYQSVWIFLVKLMGNFNTLNKCVDYIQVSVFSSFHINSFTMYIISLNVSIFILARGKHHAAVEVFDIIPSDARESIVAQWQDQVYLTNTYLLCITLCISLTGNTT